MSKAATCGSPPGRLGLTRIRKTHPEHCALAHDKDGTSMNVKTMIGTAALAAAGGLAAAAITGTLPAQAAPATPAAC